MTACFIGICSTTGFINSNLALSILEKLHVPWLVFFWFKGKRVNTDCISITVALAPPTAPSTVERPPLPYVMLLLDLNSGEISKVS